MVSLLAVSRLGTGKVDGQENEWTDTPSEKVAERSETRQDEECCSSEIVGMGWVKNYLGRENVLVPIIE